MSETTLKALIEQRKRLKEQYEELSIMGLPYADQVMVIHNRIIAVSERIRRIEAATK